MTNINLTTREADTGADYSKKDGGVFLLAVFILALMYFGVLGYNYWLSKDLDEKNKEYAIKYDAILEKGKSVFDFQNRLEVAKSLLAKKNYALEGLGQIEKALIPGVYVESFKLSDDGQIQLVFVANQYRLAANQLASLKRLDYFSGIEINQISALDGEKVSFPLKLTIKDKK